jgi:hypothetical protein
MSQLLFLWFHAKLEDCKVLKGLRTFHHSYKVAFYLIYIIKNCNRDIQILWNQIDPCHSHCFSDSRNIMLLGSQTIINLRVFQDISTVLSVLRFTASDYPFGIFKLFILSFFENRIFVHFKISNKSTMRRRKFLELDNNIYDMEQLDSN